MDCDAGKYANATETANCHDCPAGKFSEKNSTNCTECPVGRFTGSQGLSECRPCEPGFYANVTG